MVALAKWSRKKDKIYFLEERLEKLANRKKHTHTKKFDYHMTPLIGSLTTGFKPKSEAIQDIQMFK